MATDAINAEYLADALDFANELKENGHQASFGATAEPSEPWMPAGDYAETGTANVFPDSWKQDFSDDVKADDLFFFVSYEVDANSTGLLPSNGLYPSDSLLPSNEAKSLSDCTHMVDNGVKYSVMTIKPFKPDETVIYYEIQVRK